MKRFWPILGLLCSGGLAFSQVVCVGTPKQCQETQKKVCSSEKAEANLDLAGAKRVQGVIKDATDALFSFSGGHFQVQVRDVAGDEVLQQTSLNSEGRFTFTNVHSESLRLIVVRLVAGAAQRTGVDQPTNLRCENAEDCRLSIVLRVRPTDQPVDLCPPK